MPKTKKPADQNGKVKKSCPVTRTDFFKNAKPLAVVLDGINLIAMVKDFDTGSIGWHLNQKMPVTVGGVPVEVQIGLNITCIGSKELPK